MAVLASGPTGRRVRFRVAANTGAPFGAYVPAAATQFEDAETGEVLPYKYLQFNIKPDDCLRAFVVFAGQAPTDVYLTGISMEGVLVDG